MPNNNSNTRPLLKRPGRKRGKGNYGAYVNSTRPPPLTAPGSKPVSGNASAPSSTNEDISSIATPASPAVQDQPSPTVGSQPSISGGFTEETVPTLSAEESLLKDLEEAHRREEKLVFSLNEYKQETKTLKVTMLSEQMSLNVLTGKMKILEDEIATLKQENDGLTKLVGQLQSKEDPTANGRSKFIAKMMKTVDNKYIPLVIAIQRQISSVCNAETMELVVENEDSRARQWAGRCQFVKDFGLQLLHVVRPTDDGMKFTVPFPFPTVLQSKELFFIQSFESYESAIAK